MDRGGKHIVRKDETPGVDPGCSDGVIQFSKVIKIRCGLII